MKIVKLNTNIENSNYNNNNDKNDNTRLINNNTNGNNIDKDNDNKNTNKLIIWLIIRMINIIATTSIRRTPAKSCSLDPIPTSVVTKNDDLMSMLISKIVNVNSLQEGKFLEELKLAHVTPCTEEVIPRS